jgi:2-polyprenyl-3-methyl-5-hydroxy-6-metoxy-1,4-benzoquinol methylase
LSIFRNERVARFILRMLMRVHNTCYTYISKFAVMAESGIHPKHRLMNYHAFFIDNISADDALLDIGCGNGFLTYDVAAKARSVTAIDTKKENIELARRDFNRNNIKYICGDATQFDFGEKFDAVILSNILEHIENRHAFLLKVKDLASRFLIRVPMVNRDWLTYYKREMGIEHRLDSTHRTEYTMESLKEELGKAGMRIEKASVQFGEIWAVVRKLK